LSEFLLSFIALPGFGASFLDHRCVANRQTVRGLDVPHAASLLYVLS